MKSLQSCANANGQSPNRLIREVIFRPAAAADLIALFDFISDSSSTHRAGKYISRIETACMSLAEFPERGTIRNDLYPGVRIIGFERRAAIAFLVDAKAVRIVRIFYGGQQFPDGWDDDKDVD